MLALIVALFWLAILAPWAVVKFRNSRADKSIDHFHAEHEVLSRQGYSVAPARRLDDAYLYEEQAYEPEHEPARSRPRLTVVQDDDTYSSLESRTSWDEWDRDYDYDAARTLDAPTLSYPAHRFAAYASAPAEPAGRVRERYAPSYPDATAPWAPSMRVRRNRIFASLVGSAVVTTGLDALVGLSALQYLAILSWTALVLDVAAAFFAVGQGYLKASSLLGLRFTRAYSADDQYDSRYVDDLDGPAYGEEFGPAEGVADDGPWRGEPRRYALG